MQWPDRRDAFPVVAPRGIKVFLKKSTWFDHVCSGHPEMHDCLEDVLKTIRYPDEVYDFQRHRYSFRYCLLRGTFIMLIYKVSGKLGWVKTAYTVLNPYLEVEGYNRVWPI